MQCECGHLDVARWLVETLQLSRTEATQNGNAALAAACRGNQLEAALWLRDTFGLTKVDALEALRTAPCIFTPVVRARLVDTFALTGEELRSNTAKSFVAACVLGKLDSARQLRDMLDLPPRRQRQTHWRAFEGACKRGHLDSVQWLHETFHVEREWALRVFPSVSSKRRPELYSWLKAASPAGGAASRKPSHWTAAPERSSQASGVTCVPMKRPNATHVGFTGPPVFSAHKNRILEGKAVSPQTLWRKEPLCEPLSEQSVTTFASVFWEWGYLDGRRVRRNWVLRKVLIAFWPMFRPQVLSHVSSSTVMFPIVLFAVAWLRNEKLRRCAGLARDTETMGPRAGCREREALTTQNIPPKKRMAEPASLLSLPDNAMLVILDACGEVMIRAAKARSRFVFLSQWEPVKAIYLNPSWYVLSRVCAQLRKTTVRLAGEAKIGLPLPGFVAHAGALLDYVLAQAPSPRFRLAPSEMAAILLRDEPLALENLHRRMFNIFEFDLLSTVLCNAPRCLKHLIYHRMVACSPESRRRIEGRLGKGELAHWSYFDCVAGFALSLPTLECYDALVAGGFVANEPPQTALSSATIIRSDSGAHFVLADIGFRLFEGDIPPASAEAPQQARISRLHLIPACAVSDGGNRVKFVLARLGPDALRHASENPLITAAAAGNIAALKILREAGLSPKKDTRTVLINAYASGSAECVMYVRDWTEDFGGLADHEKIDVIAGFFTFSPTGERGEELFTALLGAMAGGAPLLRETRSVEELESRLFWLRPARPELHSILVARGVGVSALYRTGFD